MCVCVYTYIYIFVYPLKQLLGCGVSTPYPVFCLICTIVATVIFQFVPITLEPGSMCARLQWTGSTPDRFQEIFRADTGGGAFKMSLLQSFAMSADTCVYVYIYSHIYLHTYIYIHMYTGGEAFKMLLQQSIVMRADVCVYVYIHTHIHIYIHTYTYIYTYIQGAKLSKRCCG